MWYTIFISFCHSWYIYSSMLRIYKHYSFKLQDKSAGKLRNHLIIIIILIYTSLSISDYELLKLSWLSELIGRLLYHGQVSITSSLHHC